MSASKSSLIFQLMQSGLQPSIVAIKAKGLIKERRVESALLTAFFF
jgi:hypothetical protein